MSEENKPQFVTPAKVAQLLNTSNSNVMSMIHSNKLNAIKLGSRYLVLLDSVWEHREALYEKELRILKNLGLK